MSTAKWDILDSLDTVKKGTTSDKVTIVSIDEGHDVLDHKTESDSGKLATSHLNRETSLVNNGATWAYNKVVDEEVVRKVEEEKKKVEEEVV